GTGTIGTSIQDATVRRRMPATTAPNCTRADRAPRCSGPRWLEEVWFIGFPVEAGRECGTEEQAGRRMDAAAGESLYTAREEAGEHTMTEFPKRTLDDWRTLATKDLKGKSPDGLVWNTPEGIAVKPLYTAADLQDLEHLDTLP